MNNASQINSLKLTPMLQQYLGIKKEYQDCLLFFRMGDFYELFFEDAEVAAKELQIALTSRNPNAETKIPMCGVPYHAVQEYLKKLLAKGYKVAICDQVEDPKTAKTIVKREVTKILTPGTIIEDLNLDAKRYNFLAAIYWNASQKKGGLVWADFSVGAWSGLYTDNFQEISQWLYKLEPTEILVPATLDLPNTLEQSFKGKWRKLNETTFFSLNNGVHLLKQVEKVSSLKTIDLEDKEELVRACGSILTYYVQTQKTELFHFQPFQLLNTSQYLLIDDVSERNLELFTLLNGQKGPGTLIYVLDQTKTPMGGRLLRERLSKPWKKLKTILSHQQCVRFFKERGELRSNLRILLDKVYDLERLGTRIFLAKVTPKDLVSLRNTLLVLPAIAELFRKQDCPTLLKHLLSTWDNLQDVAQLLNKAILDNPSPLITEGNIFKSGFDPALDQLIELTEHGTNKLEQLLKTEQEKNNLPKLKLGYNKVFGYYFEISKIHQDKVPAYFERKQTLVNSERFVTQELKTLEEKIVNATEQRKLKEYELFQKLREDLAKSKDKFLQMAKKIAVLDYWQALAEVAHKWDWSAPILTTGTDLQVKQGRHPSLEQVIGKANYIATDVCFPANTSQLIITGPNMAGKSTILRQTALILILAQMGSFVPAREAKLGIVDKIFSRVGASDNIAQGQSTFMVEMTETARILRLASKKSFVILDEIGRGTSTFDGLSIAWAVAEELSRREVRTLFATHYHELTQLSQIHSNIANFHVAIEEWKGEIIFLRKLIPGPTDKSYGLEVAKLAGLPPNVLKRAQEILKSLEKKEQEIKQKMNQKSLFSLVQKDKKNTSALSYSAQEYPLIKELRQLDLNNLTPLAALSLLDKWKKQIRKTS